MARARTTVYFDIELTVSCQFSEHAVFYNNNRQVLFLVFVAYWKATTEPFIVFGSNRKVPDCRAIRIGVALNFTAEKISWTKSNIWMSANTIDECSKTIIYDIIAIPATEQKGVQYINLMVSNLVVGY